MGLVALLGLFMASRAHDEMFSYFGLAVFAFGVLFILGMIVRATGPAHGSDDFGPAEP